jgi:hypothetical protein
MQNVVPVTMVFVLRVRVMVLNATLSNISVISWQSVLLVEETGVLGENHQLAQGQHFAFLLQLPTGYSKIAILVAQQLTFHMK